MGACHSKAAGEEEDVGGGSTRSPRSPAGSVARGSGSKNEPRGTANQDGSAKTPTASGTSAHNGNPSHSSTYSEADLLTPGRPLPTDPAALRSLVQTLQHALASREMTLRDKDKELQMERAQRVSAATGVLNQAMKIIRPSTSAPTGGKRDSISAAVPSFRDRDAANSNANGSGGDAFNTANSTPGTSHPLGEVGGASFATTAAPTPAGHSLPTGGHLSALPAPTSAHAIDSSDDRDTSVLRRELMDVLLAFAENELLAPNAQRSAGAGGAASFTMNDESFSAVINQSSLDDVTKQWLTAEFTRDQPQIGSATRQRHVSVVNTRTSGSPSSLTSSSFYAQSKLLISPDLVSLSELESWEFDPTSYAATPELLVVQAFKMFESLDLLKRFSIEPVTLSNFMFELERNYIASNPYHNFLHGIDVLHCCWMYLKTTPVITQARLRSLDIFAFLISAVCHDLGHPGTCFCEETRLLTNDGFLFGDEIKTRLADKTRPEPLLFACFDTAEQKLVYRPCIDNKLSVDFIDAPNIVDFTTEADQDQWKACACAEHEEEDFDTVSHGVSLRVTPNHTMFAQWGEVETMETTGVRVNVRRDATGAELPYTNATPAGNQLRADFFLPSQQQQATNEGETHTSNTPEGMRFLSVAAGGVARTAEEQGRLLDLFATLGLASCDLCRTRQPHSECPAHAFLKLYGFWIAGAANTATANATHAPGMLFHATAETRDWLLERFTLCGLESHDFHAEDNNLRVTRPSWSSALCTPTEHRFAPWVHTLLDQGQLRALVRGACKSSSSSTFSSFTLSSRILTSSSRLRDELQVVLLHAGYAVRVMRSHSGEGQTGARWVLAFSDSGDDEADARSCRPSMVCARDVRQSKHTGRVWCVTVDHPDHLVVAQRAVRGADGDITRQSRPIIVGQSNHYQVASSSDLAMLYNDASVLENYHVAQAFRVLAMPECNILTGLTRAEWLDARKIIVSCVLATDMSHHFEMVARLDPLFDKLDRITEANRLAHPEDDYFGLSPGFQIVRKISVFPSPPPPSNEKTDGAGAEASPATGAVPLELTRDEIRQLLNVMLHSADISNPGKPWRIAKLWGDRIQSENFSQGDLERKRGLPVSPFMDRAQENQPQSSLSFIDYIVAPLVAAIVRAFPNLVPLAENLIKNRKIWHQSLLDRVSNSMRDCTGPALVAKEAERKSLTNKAQVFRTCFVLPVRKIASNVRSERAKRALPQSNGEGAASADAGPTPHESDDDDEDEGSSDGEQTATASPSPSLTPARVVIEDLSAAPHLSSGTTLARAVSADTDAETRNLVASAARQLLENVDTIVKRRHSMLEAVKETLKLSSAGTTRISISQPHTPSLLFKGRQRHATMLTSPATASRFDPLFLQLPRTPDFAQPRRVSLSQMAQQMLGATPVPAPTEDEAGLVVSPMLSPESRAAVDAIVAATPIRGGTTTTTTTTLPTPDEEQTDTAPEQAP